MSFAMNQIKSQQSNNPANQISQAAKAEGLSYWSYMAKEFPGCVKTYVWGVEKETRKQKNDAMNKIISHLGSSGNPMAKLYAQMRSLIGKRSAY